MLRRPSRSTPLYSSAASDVYKRQHTYSTSYTPSNDSRRLTADAKTARCTRSPGLNTRAGIAMNASSPRVMVITLISPGTDSSRTRCPSRSVSYTHLRAHETRHDLVCRLLLEK